MTEAAGEPLNDLLLLHGYRLVEDSWSESGRRSYMHDGDATRSQFNGLSKVLRHLGWIVDNTKLRSFANAEIGEIIEVEPGGAETTGHFLHHMTINR